MPEQYDVPKLDLSFDETRLVRLFRCLDQVQRSSLIYDLHLQLMKSHSITPSIARFSNAQEASEEELSEELPERLLNAKPYQTLIAGAHNFDIPLAETAWGIDYPECLLGTEESQSQSFVEQLVDAYVSGMDELGYDPCVDIADEDSRSGVLEEAAEYLRFWRANIVQGIEDSVALKSEKD